jgi:CxxC motif-containing protein (DUF1111 family)
METLMHRGIVVRSKPHHSSRTPIARYCATVLVSASLSATLFVGCSDTQDFSALNTMNNDALAVRRPPTTQPPQGADDRLQGGATTTFVTTDEAFAQAAPNLSVQSLRLHDEGDSLFALEFAARGGNGLRGGLGPLFNHVSCEGCHVADGRGQPIVPQGENNSLLLRIGVAGQDAHGEPLALTGFGGQIQDQAVAGVQVESKFTIQYTEQRGTFNDGTAYSLRLPTYRLQNSYIPVPQNALISPRVASPVFGLGLLEALDEQTILANADPDDRNQDGISGKANYVWDVQQQRTRLGRFGWKANQPDLRQQNAAAFNGDMGITSQLFPTENSAGQPQAVAAHPPEVSNNELRAVDHYTRTLGVPARRNTSDAAVQRGKIVFSDAKCNVCHTPSMRTGNVPNLPEISNQTIFAYTDMLVHDMGEGLADNRADFLANGREWRTPPLWGIGLTQTVNKHTQLLHDGRARNLTEAILWHDGEARQSKDYFKGLNSSDRAALVKFLESL